MDSSLGLNLYLHREKESYRIKKVTVFHAMHFHGNGEMIPRRRILWVFFQKKKMKSFVDLRVNYDGKGCQGNQEPLFERKILCVKDGL